MRRINTYGVDFFLVTKRMKMNLIISKFKLRSAVKSYIIAVNNFINRIKINGHIWDDLIVII